MTFTILFFAICSFSFSQLNDSDRRKQPYSKQDLQLNLKLAAKGSSRAMNAIGMQYKFGFGVEKNYLEAFKWFNKAAHSGYSKAWFNLGVMYKYGIGVQLDFSEAYKCFSNASSMNDPFGWYGQGYMLHKGLGVGQDYFEAYKLFRKGTAVGHSPSMYMAGICLRNGYGTEINIDSSRFWLAKAASLGYQFAKDELAAKEPENQPGATKLLLKIKEASLLIGNKNPVNQYTIIKHSLPATDIEGDFEGFLLKYDWSGKQIIQVSPLALNLSYSAGRLSGLWKEKDDNISLPFKAFLTNKGLVFENMEYKKTDHYSPVEPIRFDFKSASLQLLKNDDTVYLNGNLQLYSPDRQEPEKPFQILLKRTNNKSSYNGEIAFLDDNGLDLKTVSGVSVFPNPFTTICNIQFVLKRTSTVYTQLLSIDGKILYTQPTATLASGSYILPLQPSFNITPGTYLVRLILGKQAKTIKVVKQ